MILAAYAEHEATMNVLAITYLNRLSDLLWTMARWQEGTHLSART